MPPLVLHFDVNGTIMVRDNAGGLTVADALNTLLARAAWIKARDPAASTSTSGSAYQAKGAASLRDYTWPDGSALSSALPAEPGQAALAEREGGRTSRRC